MAKIKTANQKGKYFDAEAKTDVIDYILNPYKAIHGFVGGIGVNPECPVESMAVVSEAFGKSNGVQLRHYIVSFSQDELTDPRKANAIAQQLTAYSRVCSYPCHSALCGQSLRRGVGMTAGIAAAFAAFAKGAWLAASVYLTLKASLQNDD